jgi:hypothetical protein
MVKAHRFIESSVLQFEQRMIYLSYEVLNACSIPNQTSIKKRLTGSVTTRFGLAAIELYSRANSEGF